VYSRLASEASNRNKMTNSNILALPAPPQWMLEEAQQEQTAYERDLFERCMTIKEFRVLILPIMWNKRAQAENHVSLLLLPVWFADAYRALRDAEHSKRHRMYRYAGLEHANARRAMNGLPAADTLDIIYGPDILEIEDPMEIVQWQATCHRWYRNGRNYASKIMESIHNVNKRGADKYARDYNCTYHWGGHWGKIMTPKVEKALAFKNGRCPETRKLKAYQLAHHYNRRTMKPFWECVEILKKNPKMEMTLYDGGGTPYLHELFKN
jgi:hypothetical protein